MENLRIPESSALAVFAAKLRGTPGDERKGEDLMIVVAHPDDETIGIGGHLTQLTRTTIIHVTDGAPRDLRDAKAAGFARWEDYAEARRSELLVAMGEAGIGADQLYCLDIPDQQAARNLVPLALQLAGFFHDRHSRFVATHPFEGGHPDHDATAFAVGCACRLLEKGGFAAPVIVEMAYYHLGANGPVFQDFAGGEASPALEVQLDGAAVDCKRRMLSAFVSQRRTLAPFAGEAQRFRLAPVYDFLKPPNDGRLLYETFHLGLTGDEWTALAHAATDELELRP
jgi:N-acetylglucosamine malate deacetylase 2